MRIRSPLAAIVAIVLVAVAVFWFVSDGLEHIEDTNGPENYALQQITDENIIAMDIGGLGGPTIRQSILLGDTVEFSAEKFTGVSEILYDNYILPSDFVLDLSTYEIRGGNFKLVVVHNEQIVATLEPDLFVSYRLEDVTGTVSLRIAGESADFCFSMSRHDYVLHFHTN